ncbi:hypothetical protein GFL49_34290 [Rhizobium leguminosarum bv. viciae]|nr:hypothetical protein [Rhizobium leguminosarum bv. viciae]
MKQHGYRSAEIRRFQQGQLYLQQLAKNDLVFENFGFKIRGAKNFVPSKIGRFSASSARIFAGETPQPIYAPTSLPHRPVSGQID